MSDVQLVFISNGVELTLRTRADLERAKALLKRSYTEG
jgi:hypothetical protein